MADRESIGSYEVHCEPRGSHWVAWITRGDTSKPERSILLVGETQAKAEENARAFATQTRY